MTKTARTITATALTAVVALAPAAASQAAERNALQSAPTMRVIDDSTTLLQFTTKLALPKGADGKPTLKITVAGAEKVLSISKAGRHGKAYRYNARVRFDEALVVGRKYTARFTFKGQDVVKRLVKLQPQKQTS